MKDGWVTLVKNHKTFDSLLSNTAVNKQNMASLLNSRLQMLVLIIKEAKFMFNIALNELN